MLKVDATLDHLPVRREHIVTLLESLNQPLVNIPNVGTATTAAYVLGTRGDQGTYAVFVYLRQPDTNAVLIYVSEPRHLTAEQFRLEEAEAARFVESMGFLMSNVGFVELSSDQQEQVMSRAPLFRPPHMHNVGGLDVPTLDLVDEVTGDDVLPVSDPGMRGRQNFGRNNLVGPPTGIAPETFDTPSASQSTFTRPSQARPRPQQPQTRAPGPGRGFGDGSAQTGSGPRMDPRQGFEPRSFEAERTGAHRMPSFEAERSGVAHRQPGFDVPGQARPFEAERSSVQMRVQAPPAPAPEPVDPESLARVGRVLATFGLAIGLLWPQMGCRSLSADPDAPLDKAPQSHLDIAVEQLANGAFAEAVRALDSVLDEVPDNREALHYMGLAYMNLGRNSVAEKYLRSAIEHPPKESIPTYSVAKNTLGTLLMTDGRCEEAKQLFEGALEDIFYPTPQFAEHNLARAEWCLGMKNEAVTRLQRLVVRLPNFCLGYLTLADFSGSIASQSEVTIKACDDFQAQCVKNEKLKKYVTSEHESQCALRKGLALAAQGDVEAARTSLQGCTSSKTLAKTCQHSLDLLDGESQ